ncbi:terpene synthase family protein [Dyella acidisoli]|uniref:terpene synthase family protein n=1 Tax=Dyella acidisoli TaxID=1867834 RepID=UPI003CE54602
MPENIYNDEDVHRLRKLSSLLLCPCNDIFSYSKEAKGSSINIVSMLMRERRLSLRDALDKEVGLLSAIWRWKRR